jgi:hypothetical protein
MVTYLATVSNHNVNVRLIVTTLGNILFTEHQYLMLSVNYGLHTNSMNDVHSLFDSTKDYVLAIEPASDNRGDEELGTYGTTSTESLHMRMKNCSPLVSLPALAMERRPGRVWRSLLLEC